MCWIALTLKIFNKSVKYLLGLAMIDTVINEVLLGRDFRNENCCWAVCCREQYCLAIYISPKRSAFQNLRACIVMCRLCDILSVHHLFIEQYLSSFNCMKT